MGAAVILDIGKVAIEVIDDPTGDARGRDRCIRVRLVWDRPPHFAR